MNSCILCHILSCVVDILTNCVFWSKEAIGQVSPNSRLHQNTIFTTYGGKNDSLMQLRYSKKLSDALQVQNARENYKSRSSNNYYLVVLATRWKEIIGLTVGAVIGQLHRAWLALKANKCVLILLSSRRDFGISDRYSLLLDSVTKHDSRLEIKYSHKE